MTAPPDPWFQCAQPLAHPRLRLLCFPHAGGSASFFRGWGEHLGAMEVHGVCYPGRAERIGEPAPTDLRALAAAIAEAAEPLADRPIALFGHSFGAVVALETARALEAAGIEPAGLIASGTRAAPYPGPPSAEDDDDALVLRLLTLGGTDPAIVADPVFRELVLPYVRSDGQILHDYGFRALPRLRTPVLTIVGDEDEDADRRPWPELTDGGWQERVVPGHHFYLVAEPPFELVQGFLAQGGPVREPLPPQTPKGLT
ncbi:putative thioesterase involved in non-ribosomal peptide biosynthesis [Saccharomonospora marina XMU15]|uniref:Putative thioesterase involved in non-ribosomal peptide biosynthesis n=1 Tax=Saccharomonospora marina XMU15 TaxID=882083 RepID=H5X7T7_9PSEU|nr:alpha/beta fold hydrolase [Saccharomonospora marina]EHR52437.1 putative thioesterase involved in non-ribosomal peptide biosynthesis [Saccharomonospora marina XMU15]